MTLNEVSTLSRASSKHRVAVLVNVILSILVYTFGCVVVCLECWIQCNENMEGLTADWKMDLDMCGAVYFIVEPQLRIDAWLRNTRCENKMFMYRGEAKPISFFLRCGLKAGLDTMKFLYH